MIKLTRKAIEQAPIKDRPRNWVLDVTAEPVGGEDADRLKAREDADRKRQVQAMASYMKARQARLLGEVVTTYKLSRGTAFDSGTGASAQYPAPAPERVPDEWLLFDGSDDANIFVYQVSEEADPCNEDTFSNVASIHDMETVPVEDSVFFDGERQTENFIPFYRTNRVVLYFYTLAELDRAWRAIKFDVKLLVTEYAKADNLKTKEEIVF